MTTLIASLLFMTLTAIVIYNIGRDIKPVGLKLAYYVFMIVFSYGFLQAITAIYDACAT